MLKGKSNKSIDLEAKKLDAFQLFMMGWEQKRIANSLALSEKTLSTWSKSGKWADQRRALLQSAKAREEKLQKLFDRQLAALDALEGQPVNAATEAKLTDALYKTSAMLKNHQMPWHQQVDLIAQFLDAVSSQNPDLAKALVALSDEFILSRKPISS